jgi:SAM-dependent methyltransferase
VFKEERDVVFEGLLLCPAPHCQREYPVIDGIPLLLAGLRDFLAANVSQLMAREDLSEGIESLVGDCCGPGSAFDVTRHQVGTYARDHYGAQDPAERDSATPPGSAQRLLELGLSRVGPLPGGPVLDVGCSVGGTTFALAAQTGRLVLGVDVNLSMLRLAMSALHRGEVQYPLRRTGVVYDRRRYPVRFEHAGNVDFWACDVAALPFAEDTFALASALNVVDCVRSPRDVLAECVRALAPGAPALVSTPYDWSPATTPLEAWLGGHSQRGGCGGSGAAVLRALLTPGAHPASLGSVALEAEWDAVPWRVRLHDRSVVEYASHLVLARKQHGAATPAAAP